MARYTTDEDRASFASDLEQVTTDEAEGSTPEVPDEEQETPDEGEEVVEVEEPAESKQEPDQHAEDEPTYAVVIDGKEVQVPATELVKGYMRRDDYTRKTQQVGAQRQSLAVAEAMIQALEANPAETISRLINYYGLGEDDGSGEKDAERPTVAERRLAELEQWQKDQIAYQREAAVDAELTRLHRDYGEFDDEALFGYAVEHQINDLDTAYRAMSYGRPTAARVEKRKVAAVAGGTSRNGVAKPKIPAEEIRSFRDAYDAAKRELNSTSS